MAYVPSVTTTAYGTGAVPTGVFPSAAIPTSLLSSGIFPSAGVYPTGSPQGNDYLSKMKPDGEGKGHGDKDMSDLSSILDMLPKELLEIVPKDAFEKMLGGLPEESLGKLGEYLLGGDEGMEQSPEQGAGYGKETSPETPEGPESPESPAPGSQYGAETPETPESPAQTPGYGTEESPEMPETPVETPEYGAETPESPAQTPEYGSEESPEAPTAPAGYGNSRVKRHIKRQDASTTTTNPNPAANEVVQNTQQGSSDSGKITGKDWFNFLTSIIGSFFNKGSKTKRSIEMASAIPTRASRVPLPTRVPVPIPTGRAPRPTSLTRMAVPTAF